MIETVLVINTILLVVLVYLVYRSSSSGITVDLQPVTIGLEALEKDIQRLDIVIREEFTRNREEAGKVAKEGREELKSSFEKFEASLSGRLDAFQTRMDSSAKTNRDDLSSSLRSFQDQFRTSVTEFNQLQKEKFDLLTSKQTELLTTTELKLDKMRDVIEAKLKSIQDDNTEKLDQMRQTVDEKLQKTLDDRLGESFKIVSERLEQVQRGLGEMQALANGVGDLKKVLSNVKTRGSLGEYRLEMILEQILAPEQYDRNAVTKPGSRENVEFVVKLPSKDSDDQVLLLPIDSKFPQDRYQAVLDAYETADPVIVEAALKEMERTIKGLAKDIQTKYVNPPVTTDFAIMFLPFEGLYAEVVKRPALFETLQREYKIETSEKLGFRGTFFDVVR